MAFSDIPRAELIGLSPWISAMREKKMMLSSNVTPVDVTRAEERGTFVLPSRCESNINTGHIKPLPQAVTLAR